MAWLRKGDNAATHPLVMALATVKGTDDRLMNEVTGFVQRCAEQSAGHMTDGLIDVGTAVLIGGPTRWEPCITAAVEAGLLEQVSRGKKPTWRIAADADFIHIRPKAEIEWERQRKRDAANPDLTVPVRRRDGDACRFCGSIVNWRARRGARRGTYHHMRPGQAATYETYVVACFGCNNELDATPYEQTLPRLLPPPLQPFFGEDTVELLARHHVHVQPSAPARPGTQPDTALPRPGTQPDTAPSRPGSQPDTAAVPTGVSGPRPGHRAMARPGGATGEPEEGSTGPPDLQIPADSSRSELYGPGRVGSGQVWSGRGGSPTPPAWACPADPSPGSSSDSADPPVLRRRGRRGGRSRGGDG